MDNRILVNISFQLPEMSKQDLGTYILPIVNEALNIGGNTVHVSLQPYDPDAEEDMPPEVGE
jgi:hypothetical protein